MHTYRSRLRLAPFPWILGLLLTTVLACREEDPPAPLTVRITQPAAAVHTGEASLAVQVAVAGETADRVELLRDGELLAGLEASLAYTWELSSVAEGTYELTARAWKGKDAYTSEPLSVSVDRTGPWVVSSVPGDGAVDVQALAPVILEFSEPMDPASLQPDGIELVSGGRPVPVSAELTAGGHTLTVTPRVQTWHGRYSHVALRGARDIAGNPMQDPGEPLVAWTRAEWQHLPDVAGKEPDTAFAVHADAAGTPLVAHAQLEGGQYSILVKRWSGAAWQAVGPPIRSLSADPPVQLSLATSPENHPWVAWTRRGPQISMEVHAQAWTGSAWQSLGATPEQPGFPAAFRPATVSLRVSPQGTAYLAFLNLSTGHIKRWSGTAWEDLPFPAVTSVTNLDLELGPQGPVVAVAGRHADQTDTRISVWRWVDGGWQALSPPFNSGSASSSEPDVLMLELDATGSPVVGYISQHPNGSTMYLWVHAWNGVGWPLLGRPPQLGSFSGGSSPKWPSLVLDNTGAPWAAYAYIAGRYPNLYTDTDVYRWTGTDWVYTPSGYMEDAKIPAQLTRAGDTAMFAAGRSLARGFRASIRLETY